MRLLVVHNEGAGDGAWTRSRLEAELRSAGHDADYVTPDADLRAIIDGSSAFDAVVAVGGDGTVAEVARAMKGRAEPLAIIPAGTANNIARGFLADVYEAKARIGEWGAPARVLRLAEASEPVDGRRIEFFEAAGAGAFAEFLLDEEREGHRRDHLVSDLLNARSIIADEVMRCDPFRATIELDGTTHDDEFIQIECMNLPSFGPRLHLAPGEDPESGLLTVCAVRASERHAFADWLASPARRVEDFSIGRAAQVSLTAAAAMHVDGHAWRASAPRTLMVRGGAGTVRVWV